MFAAVVLVLVAYLAGSIPFGLLIGFARGVDVRTVGSKNIGATNVGRALGRGWALVAFACDFLKGWGPATVALTVDVGAGMSSHTLAVLCGGAAVCGHVWPIFLRFKGGKGVATGCGALVAIDPMLFVIAGGVWLATLVVTRYVGLSSILMGAAYPVAAFSRMGERYGIEVVVGAAAFTALVLVRHHANMKRMLAGTEPRFGATEKKDG